MSARGTLEARYRHEKSPTQVNKTSNRTFTLTYSKSILTRLLAPDSHKAVARANEGGAPPAYGAVQMMQIAIDIVGLAGIYYAMMLRNHPHLPATVTNAIPGYQNNQEDGAVRQLALDLINQMDANRGNRNGLVSGPVPVTLLGVTGQWSISARLEVRIPPFSHTILTG